MKVVTKNPASIDHDGFRTIYGHYDPKDAGVIAQAYDFAPRMVAEIAEMLNAPRISEVILITELINRITTKQFSTVKKGWPQRNNSPVPAVVVPLSILYLDDPLGLCRIKTPESELVHQTAEKLTLRHANMRCINEYTKNRFNLEIFAMCSCSIIADEPGDTDLVLKSEYYHARESLGRFFDSDTLGELGRLFWCDSIAHIKNDVLEASVDVGKNEIETYERVSRVAHKVIEQNRLQPDFNDFNEQQHKIESLFGAKTPAQMLV